jgi:phosphate uptake regulator
MLILVFDALSKSSDNTKYHFISALDTNINKLTFLSYKAINFILSRGEDMKMVRNSIHHRRIISSFESIGDTLKRVSRYLKSHQDEIIPDYYVFVSNLKDYFTFVTNLLDENVKLKNNLSLYLDKKQSLLREIELFKESSKEFKNLFLVISQMFKDIIGEIDSVILSVIDLRY